MNTADKVKAVRKSLNYSQQTFSEMLGVSRSALASVENGDNQLSTSMKSLICKTFNVSPEWLDTGEGDMFVEVDPDDSLMEWAAEVLKDEPESFRRRFMAALQVFTHEDWQDMERLAQKLLDEVEKQKAAPEGTADVNADML